MQRVSSLKIYYPVDFHSMLVTTLVPLFWYCMAVEICSQNEKLNKCVNAFKLRTSHVVRKKCLLYNSTDERL